MNVWFDAVLEKYRFVCSKGNLTTEDLFDLKMEELDSIYQDLVDDLDQLEGKSLYDNDEDKDKANKIKALENKLCIVETIFNYHKANKAAAEKAAKTKAMKDELNEVIAQKQKDELAGLSIDELKKIRDTL